MPVDGGLSADTCIFMEAAPGDLGNHTVAQWWLSEDLIVQGSPSGRVAIGANTINVTVRRKTNCRLTNGGDNVTVEAYACIPGPVINPVPDGVQARKLGLQTVGVPQGTTLTVPFTLNATNNPSQPEGFGHKCLIARCYPDDLTADGTRLAHLPEDQHYAQHNICIIECGPPGAARVPGPCGLEVATANESPDRAQAVTLKFEADQQPSKTVLDALLPRLRSIPTFKRLAPAPPRTIGMNLPDFPEVKLREERVGCLGRLFGRKVARQVQADIKLKPAQVTRFSLNADLAGSSFGDAHIFHLTQVGADGRLQGGLTVAMIAS